MAKRPKKAGPKTATSPSPKKQPRIGSLPQQFRGGVMAWRFNAVDKNGPFAWSNMADGGEFMTVINKLAGLETMTEAEQGQNGCHFIEIHKLSKDAQERLREIKLDDLDEIYSVHVTGRLRVFCVHRPQYMRVLWYDPNHEVCPSIKKHT